jgi:putative phosphoesterase
MKLLGLISDTHIPSRGKALPKFVIQALEGVDLILHAGDFENLTVSVALENIAPLIAVRGNMCHQEVKKHFRKTEMMQVEELNIGLTHGSGGPSGYFERILSEFSLKSMPDIIVCGHLHKPFLKKVNDIEFINPGSPTDRHFTDRNTIALLEIDKNEFNCRFIDVK